ncbi:hypothetical protein LJ753_16725 [Arthrobacter sp. zg-Y20]|uniref:hypothetical protein n=1 Tax=unclassified Arthrobacter TaxID=235627 RepID=UPI001D13A295|nr:MULTISPECIES: hypothetical protein [unclassified Arthrobacter]MCC3277510.1 hypothetical protein [Arthrobacter sp. zg-Y20]MDK1317670.1 hypothetical protein [Arthrobacter sp. zg.Y20]WIB07070.1 hypothetical protein QNO06_04900 [Arthrobacter sp. zg-Y20]
MKAERSDRRDDLAQANEHLWLSDLRKNPGGEVRLFSAGGKLISGTYAVQVTRSIDAMVRAAAKPRIITTVEELRALPNRVVIRDALEDIMERVSGTWYYGDFHGCVPALPATVLNEPGAAA